jgi:hypothetical protein
VFTGAADDGTEVTLRTNGDGEPTRVDFGDYESDCTKGFSTRNPITGFETPFDESSPESVLDQGSRKLRRDIRHVDGPVTIKASWKFAAQLANGAWAGEFKTKGIFTQRGHTLSKCVTDFAFSLAPR